MIPETKIIANEIALVKGINPDYSVSKIAQSIGYQPILIINALNLGHEEGIFKYNKAKDSIILSKDLDLPRLAISEGIYRVQDEILKLISHLNKVEMDISLDELRIFTPGLSPGSLDIALYRLKDVTHQYKLSDPGDKESVYTFLTLKENKGKLWGASQFKKSRKKKK